MNSVILYIGQDITSHLILNRVVPSLIAEGVRPVVCLTGASILDQGLSKPLEKVAFYERVLTNKHVYPLLNVLPYFKQPCYTPQQIAKIYNLKLYPSIANINAEEVYHELFTGKSNVIGAVSISCLQIFKPQMIERIREHGFLLNLHPGLLPETRGLYAPFWAMARGDDAYGVTLHHINAGIDTGRILRAHKKVLNKAQSYLENRMELASGAARLITQAIERHLGGDRLVGRSQKHMTGATYYTTPTLKELNAFQAEGLQLTASPRRMAERYLSIFKPEDAEASRLLEERLVSAIRAFETGARERSVTAGAVKPLDALNGAG